LIQGFAGLAHSFAHLFVLLFATVVLVLEREWAMGYDELFALGIPMSVLFGAGALPAGWLGDRWSHTGMLAVYFFGLGAATMLTGFAGGPWSLMLGLAGMGLFASIYHPVGIPWLVGHARGRGRALGINGVFGTLGTAAAALVAAALASTLGWRAAFVVPGAVCIAAGVAFVAVWRAGLVGRDVPEAGHEAPEPPSDRRRVFAILAVTVLCTGMIYQVTSFALPKIFDERLAGLFQHSVVGIGATVTLVYLLSALAQIAGGELADRFRLRTVYLFVHFAQVPVLAIAFVLAHPALIAAATLMIGLNIAGQPAENVLLARYTPGPWRGRVFGAKFVLTLGVSALGVAMIPLAYRVTGSLDALFPAMIAFAAAAGIAALRLPREARARALLVERAPAE
jgi:MFS family permease